MDKKRYGKKVSSKFMVYVNENIKMEGKDHSVQATYGDNQNLNLKSSV